MSPVKILQLRSSAVPAVRSDRQPLRFTGNPLVFEELNFKAAGGGFWFNAPSFNHSLPANIPRCCIPAHIWMERSDPVWSRWIGGVPVFRSLSSLFFTAQLCRRFTYTHTHSSLAASFRDTTTPQTCPAALGSTWSALVVQKTFICPQPAACGMWYIQSWYPCMPSMHSVMDVLKELDIGRQDGVHSLHLQLLYFPACCLLQIAFHERASPAGFTLFRLGQAYIASRIWNSFMWVKSTLPELSVKYISYVSLPAIFIDFPSFYLVYSLKTNKILFYFHFSLFHHGNNTSSSNWFCMHVFSWLSVSVLVSSSVLIGQQSRIIPSPDTIHSQILAIKRFLTAESSISLCIRAMRWHRRVNH